MRRFSLLLAEWGSFVMILASAFFALSPLIQGDFTSAILIGFGGVVYWTARFYVFGAVNDYLSERDRPSPLVGTESPSG